MTIRIPRIGMGTRHEGFYRRPDTTIVVLFTEEERAERFADNLTSQWQPFHYPDDDALRTHLEVWRDSGYVVEVDADQPAPAVSATVTPQMMLDALVAGQDSIEVPEND